MTPDHGPDQGLGRMNSRDNTPRPWHFWHGDDSYAMNCYGVTSEPCDHEYVDEAGHAQHTVALTLLQQPRYANVPDDWGDNTRLIVTAVNAYDRLTRIEAAARAVMASDGLDSFTDESDTAIAALRAVLEEPA